MPDRDWWSALWPDPEGILRQIGIKPEMTVLDLCCGDGYFTAHMAKLVEGKIYALDLDPQMIERAEAEVALQGASVRRWICADALQLAESVPELVDYVLMANTFHGVPDQRDLLQAVQRALRPKGLFGIINWHALPRETTTVRGKPRGPRTEMRMSIEAVRAVAESNGFRTEKIVDLPPYHYGIVFEVL